MEPSETTPSPAALQAERQLLRVTKAFEAAEDRPGQRQMTAAVADAVATKRHLIVQAGTGTGKSAAYLIPSITHAVARRRELGEEHRPVIVVTASKALQDQLATKDLPFIEQHLGIDFEWSILKGRNNYVCLQRLHENGAAGRRSKSPRPAGEDSAQGVLDLGVAALDELPADVRREIARLTDWASSAATGDMAELDWAPSDRAWAEVSVGSEECPGGSKCPMGAQCFAEAARARATTADVVVVNTFLYGLDVASDGAILPEHDVVIFDEAHQLEDVMSDTVGVSVGPGRFTRVAQALRRVLEDPAITGAVSDVATLLREALAPEVGNRLSNPLPGPITDALVDGRLRLERASTALLDINRQLDDREAGSAAALDARQRLLRATTLIMRLIEHIDAALDFGEQYVPFVSGGPEHPRLEIAPLDVGPVLTNAVWSKRTAILTSATIPSSLAERVGLPTHALTSLDVGSPFDYPNHGLLYCAMHLPDPRAAAYRDALHNELEALIKAAGGRTLALFTSWKAMDGAAEVLKSRVPYRILTQRDLPKPALLRSFSDDPESCLFATAGFFQGVDLPGDTLTLVTIDRLPFPRPDDPLLSARREKLGAAAFRSIDVPRAAILLAQAAGRLIRTATDRGVVAVLDSRLGTAGYRWDLVNALPPMRRTRQRADAEEFLASLRDAAAGR